jgi:hypothetical protein
MSRIVGFFGLAGGVMLYGHLMGGRAWQIVPDLHMLLVAAGLYAVFLLIVSALDSDNLVYNLIVNTAAGALVPVAVLSVAAHLGYPLMSKALPGVAGVMGLGPWAALEPGAIVGLCHGLAANLSRFLRRADEVAGRT